VIRQAISCDICGAEKKHTNHWFIASEQAAELRVSGWSSRIRLRAGTKHLCGQTSLHKLVDEFMARTIAGRVASSVAEIPPVTETQPVTDASLTSKAAYIEPQPTSLPKSTLPVPLRPVLAGAAIVVPMQPRSPVDEPRQSRRTSKTSPTSRPAAGTPKPGARTRTPRRGAPE
jgi:hypothetical protein